MFRFFSSDSTDGRAPIPGTGRARARTDSTWSVVGANIEYSNSARKHNPSRVRTHVVCARDLLPRVLRRRPFMTHAYGVRYKTRVDGSVLYVSSIRSFYIVVNGSTTSSSTSAFGRSSVAAHALDVRTPALPFIVFPQDRVNVTLRIRQPDRFRLPSFRCFPDRISLEVRLKREISRRRHVYA